MASWREGHNLRITNYSIAIFARVTVARHGLALPLVYNTGGYDSPEALALLDGVIDMPLALQLMPAVGDDMHLALIWRFVS